MDKPEKKEAYLEKLEAQLREWEGMWDVLKARVAKKRADMKLEGAGLLEKLEATHAEGREKLLGLRKSMDENWDSFKSEAEDLLAFLSKGMVVVGEKLKTWGEAADRAPTSPESGQPSADAGQKTEPKG